MKEINLGISQQTLVFNDDQSVPAKKFPQYIASLAATLGALAAGMTLAWTSSAGDDGKDLKSLYGVPISAEEFSWISSISAIGSAVMCIPIGILADIIGRKFSMLLMVIPFTLGWLLLIFANNLIMFYAGRFITGLSGAAFCVIAPIYTAEIAENEIRGTVGSYFQLLLTVGILLSYVLGTFVDMRVLSIISGIMPLIFFGVFMFMPESPVYYLKKGDEDSAKRSLTRLRGIQYNIENELQNQKHALEESNQHTASFWTLIKSKAALKGFIIAYGLMLFQQLSGVNVVIFYTNIIFGKTGSGFDPHYSTIIVGVMQVLAVLVSTLIVDRIGRRILLLASIIFLGLTSFALGVYFYLSENKVEVTSITWLPLTSVCIFIIMFNMGFGPLPWMMLGEIFAPEIKGVAASSACLFNWVLVFIVTKFFINVSNAIGIGETFWLFAVICVIGTFFVYLLVPCSATYPLMLQVAVLSTFNRCQHMVYRTVLCSLSTDIPCSATYPLMLQVAVPSTFNRCQHKVYRTVLSSLCKISVESLREGGSLKDRRREEALSYCQLAKMQSLPLEFSHGFSESNYEYRESNDSGRASIRLLVHAPQHILTHFLATT